MLIKNNNNIILEQQRYGKVLERTLRLTRIFLKDSESRKGSLF